MKQEADLWKFKEFSMTIGIPIASPKFPKATVSGMKRSRLHASEPFGRHPVSPVIVPQWRPNLAASFQTNSRDGLIFYSDSDRDYWNLGPRWYPGDL
jgi:hypothetical protein